MEGRRKGGDEWRGLKGGRKEEWRKVGKSE